MGETWAAMGRVSPSRRSLRRAALVLAAAAAILAIAGAGTIVLQRFEGWSAPDFDVAWERGAVLGLREEDGGYQVTLERAYADAGQVMLALAIEDLQQRPGTTQLSVLDGTLTDDTGAMYEPMGGQSGPVDTHESAELWYFDPPAFPLEPGARQFTLSVGRIDVRGDHVVSATVQPDGAGVVEIPDPWTPVAGRWVFTFDLDVAGGSMIENEVAATGPGDATVTLESLLISPTRVRVGLRVGGVDDPAAWQPVEVTASRGSTSLPFGGSQTRGDGTTSLIAYAGVDHATGAWVVTVGELVGPQIGDDSQRIRGPWTMSVDVP